jgi:GNAT superfamily N-acetyltransferase
MASAECFGLYDEAEEQIAFIAIRHMPHAQNAKIKMVHRFVVLPDYQGIGIGGKFLNFVAKLYSDRGFDFRIVTSARNIVDKMSKSKAWAATRWSVVKGGIKTENEKLKAAHRKVKTASFKYIG